MRCDVQYFCRCTIITLFVFFSSNCLGQFNVRVGFNQAFVNADVLNLFIDDYNLTNASLLEMEMGNLRSMQGIGLGIDYKLGSRTFMLHWNNLSKQHSAIGEFSDGSLLQEELFYSSNQFLFGVENSFNNIGIGTGFVYNQWRMKNRIANSDFKRTLVSDTQWAAHIHLSINFKSSDRVGFAIVPFIQIPLNEINVGPIHNELNGITVDAMDKLTVWGIQFVFINGPQ